MSKCVVCTFALLLVAKNGSSDVMLNQFKTELGDWREKITKAWHGYIRLYFFQYFKKITHLYHNYDRNFLFHIVYNSKSFLLINNERIVNSKRIFDRRKRHFPVKWPIGQLFQYKATCNWLYWNLNYKFRLNLTFFAMQCDCPVDYTLFKFVRFMYIILSDPCGVESPTH